MRVPPPPLPSPDTFDWHWETRRPGAFFVPSLDPHTLQTQGLYAAQQARVAARAKVCIYKDMLGVLFTVPPRSSRLP
jgi:hypothetical protein